MVRDLTSLRFVASLFMPGGVLVAAAWTLQKDEVMREAAAPYAVIFAIGALAAAILLCWYHDQSRLLAVASAVALTLVAFERRQDDGFASLAAMLLFPLNVVLFAALRESGVMTAGGIVKLGIVIAQGTAVALLAGAGGGVESVNGDGVGAAPPMPAPAKLLFAVAAITLVALIFRRRSKVEQGLFWVLAAVFLILSDATRSPAVLFYAGAAGLILVLSVLEHGYDIAYRDELTGLLGRRAFTSMMGQLGRTYAIAMCDVDHFKQFNDTYGHDAGDQVLKMVASKLSQVGGGGRVFRYGGEEFLVVFRGCTAREAEPYAESVRRAIADAGFVLRDPNRSGRKTPSAKTSQQPRSARPTVSITVSIGLAERSQRHSTPELVLDAADAALYRAKEAGRNCVKLADSTQHV